MDLAISDSPQIYVALKCEIEDKALLAHAVTCLSTKVMNWASGVWIIDVSQFFSYWKNNAYTKKCTVLELWQRTLLSTLPASLVAEKGICAAVADHPWRAVLLLSMLDSDSANDLVTWHSPLGQRLFYSLPWKIWRQCLSQLKQHLSRKDASKLRLFSAKLDACIAHLNLPYVCDMHILNSSAITQRFGYLINEVWLWLFAGKNHESFPWLSKQFHKPTRITRTLDSPSQLWEHLKPFLRQDLDKLNAKAQLLANQRVVLIEWKVICDNLEEFVVPICFRNPHNLAAEQGEHSCSLAQAYYSFERLTQKLRDDSDTYLAAIQAWELTLSEYISLEESEKSLFGDGIKSESDRLLKLENELSIPLMRFNYTASWVPEDSFSCARLEDVDLAMLGSSLKALANARPLYVYKIVKVWHSNGNKRCFLEQSLSKWWQSDGRHNNERRYYKETDAKKLSYWVAQDSDGKKTCCGSFG